MQGGDGTEKGLLVLGLLRSVEQDSEKTQRRLAAELGIAVGLVNAYLNRCIKKGLVKVKQAPARRYAYYLTPKGFAEKSRLSLQYMSDSLAFFREAKSDCLSAFETARARGFVQIVLAGRSDLAEIATICAREQGLQIVGVMDATDCTTRFVDLPVRRSYDEVEDTVDAVVVTDLRSTQETIAVAVERFGANRVLVPSLLQKAAGGTGSAP